MTDMPVAKIKGKQCVLEQYEYIESLVVDGHNWARARNLFHRRPLSCLHPLGSPDWARYGLPLSRLDAADRSGRSVAAVQRALEHEGINMD
jgi:hypothetical protein